MLLDRHSIAPFQSAIASHSSDNGDDRFTTIQLSMTRITGYKYIELDEQGNAIVVGTTMKIVELIAAQFAHGWSPEELHFQYPHLGMSQIHSALAYYWDHKQAIDAEIDRRYQYAEKLRQEAGESPFVSRLRAQGWLQK